MPNVISEIVDNKICVGCGACVAACPKGNLKIQEFSNGDIAPAEAGNCMESCSICLKVCPFSNEGPNETDIANKRFESQADDGELKFDEVTGYVRRSYAAYSAKEGQREAGASGGMATWVLEHLLTEGFVNKVICLAPASSGSLFEFQIFEDVESIQSCSGSHYYPVSLDKVLAEVMADSSESTYAIIGLPCVLKGISKAQAVLPKLRKIKYILGLTCGHMPNRFYTQYACALSGIDPQRAIKVTYREKNTASKNGKYNFRAYSGEEKGKSVPFGGVLSKAWINCHFQVNACNYCDDVFSEVAHICFMDAWLPRYSADRRGWSFVLVRDKKIADLLEKGKRAGDCVCESVSLVDVKQSQECVVKIKKRQIAGRIAHFNNGPSVITKRVLPSKLVYWVNYLEIRTKQILQDRSKLAWADEQKDRVKNYQAQVRCADLVMKCCHFYQKIKRGVLDPSRVYRKILNFLGAGKACSRSEKGGHMPKKVLVLDAFSAAHVGNGVLFQSSLELVKKIWPDAQVDVLALKMDTLKTITDRNYSRCLFYDIPAGKTKVEMLLWLVRVAAFMALQAANALTFKIAPSKLCMNPHRRKAMEAIESCDVAISITGEAINDVFKKSLPFYLFPYWIALKLGKKVVLFPQSIGPLKLKWTRWLVAKVLGQCEFVAARDSFAVQELKSLGMDKNKFAFSPDVGVLQPYWDKNRAKGALQRLGVDREGGPVLGVCVSKLKFRESGIEEIDFKDVLVEALKEFSLNEKIQILMMPTNMPFDGLTPKDYEACCYVKDKLAGVCPVYILDRRPYDPKEYKAITSVLDMFITTRMHACIMATMAGTPTLAISTQRKIEGYMENIHQSDCVVSSSGVTRNSLLSKIKFVMSSKKNISNELVQARSEMTSLVLQLWKRWSL